MQLITWMCIRNNFVNLMQLNQEGDFLLKNYQVIEANNLSFFVCFSENVTAEIKDSEVTDTSSNAIREEIFRARLNEKDHLQDETSGDVDKMVQSKDPEKTNPVQQKVELENLSVQENIEKEAANYSVDSSKKDGVFHKELRHRGTVKIQKNVEPPKAETSNNVNVVQSENSDSDISFGVKQLEGLKIASLVLLALVCRLVLKLGIGVMYFQVHVHLSKLCSPYNCFFFNINVQKKYYSAFQKYN